MRYKKALHYNHETKINRKFVTWIIIKETNQHAPFSHDLRKLRKISGLVLDEEKIRWLDTITTFNLNARYDDYKQEFYRKCSKDYTSLWIDNIKTLRQWIKERL